MKQKIILIAIFICLINLQLIFAQNKKDTITLDQCIELANQNNPSLQKSQINVNQAGIALKQSYSRLLPSVNLGITASSSETSLPGSEWDSQWNIQGTVEQNIYQPGLFSKIKQAKTNDKIAQISNDDFETQIRLMVESTYFQILTSKSLIYVYKENIKLAEKNLEKIRVMYDVGARTESDILKAEVQKGDFEMLLIIEQERLLNYKRSLNIILGQPPEANFDVEDISAETINIPEFENAKNILFENNREYQIGIQQINSQKLSLKIAKEAFLPSISGFYNHTKSNDFAGDSELTSKQVGIRVSRNLFEGFSKKRTVQKEKLNVGKSKIDLQETERELIEELTNLYTSLQTYNNLISIHEKNAESSKRDLELVTERYAVGASTILDQMNAQASLLQSQSNLVKVKYSRKIVEAQIRQLLGV